MGFTFKKRYIVFGLLTLELLTLPAAAHYAHKKGMSFDMSIFSKPQHAINIKLKSKPGIAMYMVSANAPFSVTTEAMIGRFDVNIHLKGRINGQFFGENAQPPGPETACAVTKTTDKRTIYRSEKGTIAQDGDILSKTVLVEIRYEAYNKPDIKILTQKKSEKIASAPSCAAST